MERRKHLKRACNTVEKKPLDKAAPEEYTEEMRALQKLFTLDKDDTYSIQLVIWSNNDEVDCWDEDYMIHPEDLDDDNIISKKKDLDRFLSQYKKQPIGSGIVKKKNKK